jgi:tetratricopeptide (TPR) repeat protein
MRLKNIAILLVLIVSGNRCAEETPSNDEIHKFQVFYPLKRDTMDKYAKTKSVFMTDTPNDPALRYIDTGLAMFNSFNFDKAINYYTQSIKIKPYSHAYSNRGNARLAMRDTVGALQDYYAAITADSTNPTPFFNRANVFTAQKRYIEALTDYNSALKALTITKKYYEIPASDIYLNRGNSLFYLNDLKAAIKDYSYAIEIDQKNLMAFANRAEAKNKIGDFKSAIEDYTKAIAINNDATFFLKRAMSYMSLQEFRQALPDLDWTIKLNPSIWDAYYMRAQVKGRLNDFNAAIADIDKMIELQPGNSEGYLMRGMTYSVYLKNPEKGCSDLQRAFDLGDNRAQDLLRQHCSK